MKPNRQPRRISRAEQIERLGRRAERRDRDRRNTDAVKALGRGQRILANLSPYHPDFGASTGKAAELKAARDRKWGRIGNEQRAVALGLVSKTQLRRKRLGIRGQHGL